MSEKAWKYVAIGAIILILGWAVFSHFSMAPAIFEEQRQSAKEGVKDTYDWETAVQNYRWFKQQKEDIEAKRQQIDNYKKEEAQFHKTYGDDPSDWSRTAEKRHGRLHTRITAAKNAHDQMVAKYNARASDATRAMFQCGLPYEMEDKFWLGDGRPDDQYMNGTMDTPPEEADDCTALKEKYSEN